MLAQTINGILQGIGKSNVPLIAFSISMICKFLANIILVSNKYIGIKGAVIGNIICNAIVFFIGFKNLKKNIKIKIDYKNLIIKPFFATFIMIATLIFLIFLLNEIFSTKIATVGAILLATMAYGVAIVTLKLTKKY